MLGGKWKCASVVWIIRSSEAACRSFAGRVRESIMAIGSVREAVSSCRYESVGNEFDRQGQFNFARVQSWQRRAGAPAEDKRHLCWQVTRK